MKRLLPSLVLLVVCAGNVHAQEQSRWTGPRAERAGLDTTLSFTRSGDYLSVLWADSVTINLSGPADALTAVRTGTFSAGLQHLSAPATLTFVQDLRFAVHKDRDARVVLVAVLPDRTETLVFPYGETFDEAAARRRFRSRLRYREGQRYTASFLVRVDRRRPDAAVVVQVDGLDLQVIPPGA